MKEKTNNISKSINSTKGAIADEQSKILAIKNEIEQKIIDLDNSIASQISQRKELLNNLIKEKNQLINNETELITKIKEITTQCIKIIREKIDLSKNNKIDLLKLLNSSTRSKLDDIELDQQANLKLYRFNIPIYYIIIRDTKKSTEFPFLIPPCILPLEIKKIKNHAIYGKSAKWIAVDPFDRIFVDEIINPLTEMLNNNVLLLGKINSVMKIGIDKHTLESQFYPGLKILYENGYLNYKNYKKATTKAMDFFKPEPWV